MQSGYSNAGLVKCVKKKQKKPTILNYSPGWFVCIRGILGFAMEGAALYWTYQTVREGKGISKEELKDISSAVAFLLQGKPQVPHVLKTTNNKEPSALTNDCVSK